MSPVDLAYIENAADIRVRDLSGIADLGVKALESGLVILKVIGKELESDRLRELDVLGLINLAHPAFADEVDYAVTARQHSARDKITAFYVAGRFGGNGRFVFVAGAPAGG